MVIMSVILCTYATTVALSDGVCTGTSVTAGGNFVPPFNQNFHDNLIPWPSPLYAATSSQQISQDLSMIPKWFIMLGVLGLLSVIISLSVKNIKHRRIVFMLFLIIIGTAVSCMKSSDSSSSENSTSSSDKLLIQIIPLLVQIQRHQQYFQFLPQQTTKVQFQLLITSQ